MRFLDEFRSPKVEAIDDPLFGRLTRLNDCWSGTVTFAPTGKEVTVQIDTGASPPGDAHRRFFQEFERRYPELSHDITIFIQDYVSDIDPEGSPSAVSGEFPLLCITLPPKVTAGAEWDAVYGWTVDEEWCFSVYMHGWEVSHVGGAH